MRPQFSAEHPYGIKPQDREQPSEQPEPSGTASGQREKQERAASPSDSSDGERARRRSPSRGSDESEAYHTGEDDSRSSSRTKSENIMGADYEADPSESSGGRSSPRKKPRSAKSDRSKSQVRFANEEMEERVERVETRVDTLTTRSEGEVLYGLLCQIASARDEIPVSVLRILDGDAPGVNMEAVVNYRDVGGMTPLHRAARVGSKYLVQKLMEHKADANAVTYPSRSPGKWTPLQCLCEANQSKMDKHQMKDATWALLNGMSSQGLANQNTKDSNAFHQVVTRGNYDCLTVMDAWVRDKSLSHRWLKDQVLNKTTDMGSTVLDCARYNRKIANVIKNCGGVENASGKIIRRRATCTQTITCIAVSTGNCAMSMRSGKRSTSS